MLRKDWRRCKAFNIGWYQWAVQCWPWVEDVSNRKPVCIDQQCAAVCFAFLLFFSSSWNLTECLLKYVLKYITGQYIHRRKYIKGQTSVTSHRENCLKIDWNGSYKNELLETSTFFLNQPFLREGGRIWLPELPHHNKKMSNSHKNTDIHTHKPRNYTKIIGNYVQRNKINNKYHCWWSSVFKTTEERFTTEAKICSTC